MIKQVAGRKIQTGGATQGAGALFKPNLASQDLIAQFSKLVEEISAQLELINGEGKDQSFPRTADSPQERVKVNDSQSGSFVAQQDSTLGMGVVSTRSSSKDKKELSDISGYESEESSIGRAQRTELSDDTKNLEVGEHNGKYRSDPDTKKADLAENNGDRADSPSMLGREGDSDQEGQEIGGDSSGQQPTSLESQSRSGGDDADSASLSIDSLSTSFDNDTENLATNPEGSVADSIYGGTAAKDLQIQKVNDAANQNGYQRDPNHGVDHQAGLEQEVIGVNGATHGAEGDSSYQGEGHADQGVDDGSSLAMGLGGSGVASQAEVQSGSKGSRAVSGLNEPAEGLEPGVDGQDEQLLGALREQAGQRVQETAANNQKLAKTILERLTGDLGRGDTGTRALDAATGASSSSVLLGDTLGKLAQGEKFLPRQERALLSQGIQLRTMERIEQALKEVERSKDGKSISIRLDPPNLGHVRTDITLNDGVLYARFVPENRDIAQVLRERASELQSILKRAGFDADRVQISVSSGSLNEQGAGFTSTYDGKSSGDQLFQHQGYRGDGGTDSGKDGWRDRGFEQKILVGAGSKTEDHWVA